MFTKLKRYKYVKMILLISDIRHHLNPSKFMFLFRLKVFLMHGSVCMPDELSVGTTTL